MQLSLTEKSIESIQVEKKTVVQDGGPKAVEGLSLVIYPSGKKSWRFSYRSPIEKDKNGNGQQRRPIIGQWPALKIQPARTEALKIKLSVSQGKDPRAPETFESDTTVRALYAKYTDLIMSEKKQSYRYMTDRIFIRDVLPKIGNILVTKLSKRMVVDVWESVEARNKKAHPGDSNAGKPMAGLTYRSLSAFFRTSIDRGWIDTNPILGVRYANRISVSRERFLSLGEISAFWHGLDKTTVRQITKDALRLLLLTGQRSAEIREARISEIDLSAKTYTIPKERTKNKRQHIVPLCDLAMEIITNAIESYEGQREKSDLLFPAFTSQKLKNGNASVPMNKTSLSQAVKKNLRAFGCDDDPFRPHDLRRTMATHMVEYGIAPHIVEKVVNHKSGEISGVASVYIRSPMIEQTREAMNLWGEMVKKAIEVPASKVEQLHG